MKFIHITFQTPSVYQLSQREMQLNYAFPAVLEFPRFSMIISDDQFLSVSSQIFNESQHSADSLCLNLLQLDDAVYEQFWARFSLFTSIKPQCLKYYFQQLCGSVFQTNQKASSVSSASTSAQPQTSSEPKTDSDQNGLFKFRESVQRRKSPKLTQKRAMFTKILQTALAHLRNTSFEDKSEAELCDLINEVRPFEKTGLWKEVAQMNGTTSKQALDYYHHTYQNVLYEQLSIHDKGVLRTLNLQLQHEKPTQVTNRFMEMTGNKYFKHNVTMYIVNLRRNE
ncbi:Hypothetical_protein [Hexamita inflata]|uniref:Hypothetical_protein n=2 Tax=Hexamita inflata TaxID=28002 RepID=A0AA86TJ45_9EUKA|nr:Hypothetical protein HINF_LOCUS6690 [Hexamita inflata]